VGVATDRAYPDHVWGVREGEKGKKKKRGPANKVQEVERAFSALLPILVNLALGIRPTRFPVCPVFPSHLRFSL